MSMHGGCLVACADMLAAKSGGDLVMGVIFAKTAKGHEEIEKRTGRGTGLSPRVRRVLIFVDGRRSVDELRGMLAADDLTHTLGLLEEEGFIEMVAGGAAPVPDAAGAQAPVPAPLPSITAFRPLESGDDPMNLAKARNFMTNTLNVFVGSLGASSLLDRIQSAGNLLELRALFDEWFFAVVSSRDGKREAEALRTKLLDVI